MTDGAFVGGEPTAKTKYEHGHVQRDVVWGHTIGEHSHPFTLLRTFDYPSRTKFGGMFEHHERVVLAGLLVIGEYLRHLDDITAVRAERSSLPFTFDLDFGVQNSWFMDPPEDASFSMGFRRPPLPEATIGDTTVRLGLGWYAPSEMSVEGSEFQTTLRATPRLSVVSEQATTYQHLFETYLIPLGRMVDFAANRQGAWTSVQISTVSSSRPLPIFHMEISANHRASQDDGLRDRNLCLNTLDDRFEAVVLDWLRLHDDFSESLDAGMSGLAVDVPIERARLLVTALEGLSHLCRSHLEERLDQVVWDVLKPQVSSMLDAAGLDRELVGRVRDALSGSTLREKLESIATSLREEVEIELPEDLADAIPTMKNVRNNQSHKKVGQEPPGAEEVRTAALWAERLYRGLLLASLPLGDEMKRTAVQDVISDGRVRPNLHLPDQ